MTTIGVGGPSRYFVEAATAEDVKEAITFARSHKLSIFVLGGGSNLVVSDAGFQGLVLKIGLRGINEHMESPEMIFDVAAGEDWDAFVARSVARNCAGVECLSGIPGTVGGTPIQNVGAYGQEVAETISSVHAIEIETLAEREFSNSECNFAYRSSRFNTTDRGRYIIIGVSFSLSPNGAPKIAYGDLKKHFAENATPTLAQVRETVLQVRKNKGMVLVDGDADCRSAGSFFKNPVLTTAQFSELEARAAALGLTIPSYPALAAQHKVSAAWLIEHAGFPKGYSRGPVGLSTKHTLALTNRGGATATDVIALKIEIQREVKARFGIDLHPEPVFLGFERIP